MLRDHGLMRSFDVDHPDGVVADEGDAASVRGPDRAGYFRAAEGRQLHGVRPVGLTQPDLVAAGAIRNESDALAVR